MSRRIIFLLILGILLGALATILLAPSLISNQEQQHSVFVYGTLRNNLVRFYACHCLVPETPTELYGYRKIGLNIVPSENDSVSGSIINISETQLQLIDTYENIPQRYTREKITIDNRDHWVYLMVTK